MKTKHARVRTHGFSLIELMIVVAITGILAATAIPTFITYIYKSRTSEAVSFLGVIKLKQEAYRSEFGQYLTCMGGTMGSGTAMSAFATANNFVPTKGSGSASLAWSGGTCFNTLGASPDGPVRFRYGWIAGTPATMPADVQNALGLGATVDHYWVAQAHADLDDDGTWCVYELSSFTRNIWVGDTAGNDLAAGWE
jgi:prepilin-type N-terminal cleavage/methylation domain-containing protein